MRRPAAIGTVVGLATSILTIGAGSAPAAPGVSEQRATVTTADRVPGMPTSTAPGHTLAGAEVLVEHATDWFYEATVQLESAPARDGEVMLRLGFGQWESGACRVTYSTPEVVDRSSTTYVVDYYYEREPDEPTWTCVQVFTTDTSWPQPTVTYDALAAPLVDTTVSPELELSAKKRVKLVPGAWTRVDVDVANTGPVAAGPVVVTGRGAGLKVRKGRTDDVPAEGERTVSVWVKLAGAKQKASLRLTARADDVSATRTVAVRRTPPPPPPVSGKYAGDGPVSFTVKGRTVTGFMAMLRVQCGIAPGYTYSSSFYDFPKATIARNGLVDATARGDGWSTALSMKVVGRTAKGTFHYSSTGPCTGTTSFTAKVKR